jgi:hypothetical protein
MTEHKAVVKIGKETQAIITGSDYDFVMNEALRYFVQYHEDFIAFNGESISLAITREKPND